MADMPNQAACASLHGLRLEDDLPMGAAVADPAEWEKVLNHYRGAARDMRDGAGEYLVADPYHAEWHQLEAEPDPEEERRDRGVNGAFLWALVAFAIEAAALYAWWPA